MIRKLALIMLLLMPATAHGFTPEKLELKYSATWNGLPAGEMRVIIDEMADSYSDQVFVNALGLVLSLTHYTGANITKGNIADGKYQPIVFDSSWQPKKGPRQKIVVNFAPNGDVAETATPPEDRSKHLLVEYKDKRGLPDPITAGVRARRKVAEIMAPRAALPQAFAIRFFDGRRVADLDFNIIGYVERSVGGAKAKLLKITLKRVPVAGFRDKELLKLRAMDPIFDIYVDDNYIPISAVGRSSLGTVDINLLSR